MSMPGVDIQYITILSQWVVVLEYCYLDLHVDAKYRGQDYFTGKIETPQKRLYFILL